MDLIETYTAMRTKKGTRIGIDKAIDQVTLTVEPDIFITRPQSFTISNGNGSVFVIGNDGSITFNGVLRTREGDLHGTLGDDDSG